MTDRNATQLLYRGVTEVLKRDIHLLRYDCNERSMSHRLALYLEDLFPDYDVDCEYNRNMDAPKYLDILNGALPRPRPQVELDATIAITIYPDIIIHERGSNDNNLLAIEIKKDTNRLNSTFDCTKLRGLRDEYGYRLCAAVRFVTGNNPDARIQWVSAIDLDAIPFGAVLNARGEPVDDRHICG